MTEGLSETDRRLGRWPRVSVQAQGNVVDALSSGRWAISSTYDGRELYERRFARAFSRFNGVEYCVPTDHASSALIMSLEVLDGSPDAEVVVPALTWTATASAVFRAGLTPVLADVDPRTGCLTAESVKAVLTPKTIAVIVVHWACVMADVPAIVEAVSPLNISVIEDASQAHGAAWKGRMAGSIARFGCFSMQNAKVLTCGEGGALITNDVSVKQRLEELHADSRSNEQHLEVGLGELAETASILGSNFCLGELAAALLLAQLEDLPRQNETRESAYSDLQQKVAHLPFVSFLERSQSQTASSIYEVPLIIHDYDPRDVAQWLSSSVGIPFYLPRTPLNQSALLRPLTKAALGERARKFAATTTSVSFPGAMSLSESAVVFHHAVLLDGDDFVDPLVAALACLPEMGRHL